MYLSGLLRAVSFINKTMMPILVNCHFSNKDKEEVGVTEDRGVELENL